MTLQCVKYNVINNFVMSLDFVKRFSKLCNFDFSTLNDFVGEVNKLMRVAVDAWV